MLESRETSLFSLLTFLEDKEGTGSPKHHVPLRIHQGSNMKKFQNTL